MRRPSRLAFSVLCAGSLLTVWNGWLWLEELIANPFANDFIAYYGGARLGVSAGWRRLYDVALQQHFEYATGSHSWEPFVNPPPLAWIVAPLTALDFRTADWLWGVLLLLVIAGAAWASAPAGGFRRSAGVVAVVGWFPTGFALLLGQAAILVAGSAALAAKLLVARRDVLAGVALTGMALKPQDAILVPLALLVAGRPRAFASWVVATAVLASVSALELGRSGLQQAFDLLGWLETAPLNHRYAVEGTLGVGWPAIAAQVFFGAAALYAARRRRQSAEAVLAIGLVGSFLVVPHLSLQDFCVVAVAGLLLLRSTPGIAVPIVLTCGFVAGEFAIPLGPIPLLVSLLALLAAGAFFRDVEDRPSNARPDERRPPPVVVPTEPQASLPLRPAGSGEGAPR